MKERLREIAPAPIWAAASRARNWGRKLGYLRERWPRPLGTRPPIALAVCAIFRDEARYLAEWVNFHRIQGVERFYLYDNRSTDDWRTELEPEIDAGIVEVQHWPFVPGQRSAYDHCLEHHREDARWIAFIDIDEFLFSPTGRPLPEVLRDFDLHPGVVVNWRIYGTNGFEQPPDGLVIENYLRRPRDDYPGNGWMKSIVNPRRTLCARSAHHFKLRGEPVAEDHLPAKGIVVREPTAELLRINHYYAKSEEEFRRKAERPVALTGEVDADREPPPADVVRDETVLRFAPDLRSMLASRVPPRGAPTSSATR
jgi:Glycosyltransferase family 92